MPVVRSPEIESVARRFIREYAKTDQEVASNLVSRDPSLRVVGNAAKEYWSGSHEFLEVRRTQISESPDIDPQVTLVEAFEDGNVGWFAMFARLVTEEISTEIKITGVLRLEGGVWRVVLWHNAVPVANTQLFGVELTTTLVDLVDFVLEGADTLPDAIETEGTLSLVFTDIVGSTSLAERVGDAQWTGLIAAHEAAIRAVTEKHHGTVIKMLGDGSLLAFDSARSAVRAAVELQLETTDAPYDIRIGVHTGDVMRTGDDLFGLTVNKAARVASASSGSGITISSTTRDLIGSLEGVTIGEPTTVALKGLSGTHQIVAVDWT